MSRVLRDQAGLRALAREIRTRYDDELLLEDDAATDPEPEKMDVRERKWAAAKLLRPVYPDDVTEDCPLEDWLEVCRESWTLRLRDRGDAPELFTDRVARQSRQFAETRAFVTRLWGLPGPPVPSGPLPVPARPEPKWVDATRPTYAFSEADGKLDEDDDVDLEGIDDADLFDLDTPPDAADTDTAEEADDDITPEEAEREIQELFEAIGSAEDPPADS